MGHQRIVSSSEIDYIFCNAEGKELVLSVKVEHESVLNGSDHWPIIAELSVVKLLPVEEQKMIALKPNWDLNVIKVYIDNVLGTI